MKKKAFDLLTLGEILLRLSPPDNERIVLESHFRSRLAAQNLT